MRAPEEFVAKVTEKYPKGVSNVDAMWKHRWAAAQVGGWPNWCSVPLYMMREMVREVQSYRSRDVSLIGAAVLWRRDQWTADIGADFPHVLMAKPFKGELPGDKLTGLPAPCVYVQCSMEVYDGWSRGFFAWVDWERETERKVLRVVFQMAEGEEDLPFSLPLEGMLHTAIRELNQTEDLRADGGALAKFLMMAPPFPEKLEELFAGVLNILVYLCDNRKDEGAPDVQTR